MSVFFCSVDYFCSDGLHCTCYFKELLIILMYLSLGPQVRLIHITRVKHEAHLFLMYSRHAHTHCCHPTCSQHAWTSAQPTKVALLSQTPKRCHFFAMAVRQKTTSTDCMAMGGTSGGVFTILNMKGEKMFTHCCCFTAGSLQCFNLKSYFSGMKTGDHHTP